jgi:hypothetical protein
MAPRGRPKQLNGETRIVSVRITNNVYENIKARGDDMSTTLREIIEAGLSVYEIPAPVSVNKIPAAEIEVLEAIDAEDAAPAPADHPEDALAAEIAALDAAAAEFSIEDFEDLPAIPEVIEEEVVEKIDPDKI